MGGLLRRHPAAARLCPDYTVERFGDSAELADELLEVALDGRKRATAELVEEFGVNGIPFRAAVWPPRRQATV